MDHLEGTAALKLVQKIDEVHKANSVPDEIPYFIITNDLCNKVLLVLVAFAQRKLTMTKADAVFLLDALMDSYDDPPAQSCCAFYHSRSRKSMEEIKGQLLPMLPEV